MMQFDGIDLANLKHEAEKIEFPPVVPGRTVHVDADFLAYQVTAEKADGTDTKTWDDMKHNAEVAVETLRGLAAAERVHLHLTPSSSNKGGRYDLAIIKEYQGNREDDTKPRHLSTMRNWLASRYTGTMHEMCEADDGMSSYQYAALAAGDGNKSIIASKDKDLRMVPGLHLDWTTGEITDATEFGSIVLHEHTSASGAVTKTIKGYGQKFFWAQMLTGDAADNISGLPRVSGRIMNEVRPTQAVQKDKLLLADHSTPPWKAAKAIERLEARKAAQCGPVLAYELLENLNDNRACFNAVKALYRLYGEETGFTHWRTGDVVPWGRVFVSEAQLLWMRKDAHNENCVLNWWRDIA